MKFFLILIAYTICFQCFGQENSKICNNQSGRDYLKSYYTDACFILRSPSQWRKQQYFIAAEASTIAAVLFLTDRDIQRYSQKMRSSDNDKIAKYFLEPWGSGIYSVGCLGIMFITGKINGKNKLCHVALQGVKAYLLTGAFTQVPKILFNRHRPSNDNPPDPFIFDGPFSKTLHMSFFSGHSASVFSIASVIAHEYNENKAIGAVAYTVAGLTSLSRIYANRHWASDVFCGALAGYLAGKLIAGRNPYNIAVSAWHMDKSNGLSLSVPF